MGRSAVGGILLAGLVLALTTGDGEAKVVEEIITLPVEAGDAWGRRVSQPITVTIVRDDARAKQPFLLLNHGRAGTAAEREKMGRSRYPDSSRYLVKQGFAVFMPTRIGYGVSGGPDVENSGDCRARMYPPVYEAAAEQSVAVIAYAKAQPWIDPNKGLVVGQSFGGATAIALAAKNIPGVRGVANFAGGGGGDPKDRPGQPCRPDLMGAMFASYGPTAKVPTIWFYSENDKFFGKEHPRQWFDGFIKAGGKGRFVQLPPYKDDGHPSFSGQPDSWHPAFEAFLREVM